MLVIDERPPHGSSFNVLPRNPSWVEVVRLFKIGKETHLGEGTVPLGFYYWSFVGVVLNEGPVVYKVRVLQPSGLPGPGIRVVRHWPSAPYVSADPHLYSDRGVVGTTEYGGDKFGCVEFQYTKDSVVGPNGGPDSFWIVTPFNGRYFSDMAFNFGWLGGTVHLNPSPVFQLKLKGTELPDEEPTTPEGDRLAEFLRELEALIEEYK